jgi:hypothetical protein
MQRSARIHTCTAHRTVVLALLSNAQALDRGGPSSSKSRVILVGVAWRCGPCARLFVLLLMVFLGTAGH